MKQRRFRIAWGWVAVAVAAGVIATFSVSLGSREPLDPEFLLGGGFIAFCIYLASHSLHFIFGHYVDAFPGLWRKGARISMTAIGGLLGYTIGYTIMVFVFTGRLAFPLLLNRMMQWMLIIVLAITILIGLLVQGYDELRRRLAESIDRLKATEYAEREIEMARSIQARLLPPPTVEGRGYVVTSRNMPAHYVAGDFCDVLHHDDGTIGVVIADVVGKGMGASLIMASVKAVLPFLARATPGETLGALNRKLRGELARREFVALAYARFDPATGELRVANAGMPDPYHVGPRDVVPIVVSGPRLPLGINNDLDYRSTTLQLERGDRILFVSDGIPEACLSNGELLGYDALRDLISAIPSDGSAEWLDTLLDAVRLRVQSFDDDCTAVVLQRV